MSIGIFVNIIVFAFFTLMLLEVIVSFGDREYLSNERHSIMSLFQYNKVSADSTQSDITPPSINITYPSYPLSVMTGKTIIEGNASDSLSGIRNIYAAYHTFPFNGKFRPLTLQSVETINNRTDWSVPLIVDKPSTYRVIVVAIDNAGNANIVETTINMMLLGGPSSDLKGQYTEPRIAFIRPTFTEAAYQPHGFFDFYNEQGLPPIGKNITEDIDKLTVRIPKSVPEFQENDPKHLSNVTSLVPVNGTELRDISYNYFPVPQNFWKKFIDNVKLVIPNSIVTVIRDEDVHDGRIFYNEQTTNAFNILLLVRSEYVTQQEYDNLKQFVKNGGTIVFTDANVFRAEVKYDRDAHTISLLKGHDWQFDGNAASRSVTERWYNETKDWVGSNFLDVDTNATFTNNPFNYTHFEEQFVNNPKAKILVDYGIKFPKEYIQFYSNIEKLPGELSREHIPIENITVATYSMDYGKGKIVMLGLTGRQLADNQEFIRFFDNIILPSALCPGFKFCT